jgi:integrase
MSVRKRKWTTGSGEARETWIVDYVDQHGKRRLKTFSRKKEADAFEATASVEIGAGMHVADTASITVKAAGENWIASAEAAGLERSTTEQYRAHLSLHIAPLIGETLLTKLTMPSVRAFEDQLRASRSPAMVRKVMRSLGAMIADAQERGQVARNVVRDLRGRRQRGKDGRSDRRQKGKLRVGLDIPTRDEIRAVVAHVAGRWRPLLITAIFTGLRASELRGLRWVDVDIEARAIRVRQRADKFNAIGKPKSAAGERDVPMPPLVVNTLREWKLACPRGELGLVFPNGAGKVESLPNIVQRGFIPCQIAAGVTQADGAKYTGLHTLRHFYASWCINRPQDGGLGLPAKVVQERLGHSSITVTMDVYGHLFPRGDDADELAAAERALLG